MRLYNFIKIYLGYEKNIHNAAIKITDSTKTDNKKRTQ